MPRNQAQVECSEKALALKKAHTPYLQGYTDEIGAAEFLKVSVPALRDDRLNGTMGGVPYSKIGRRVRYSYQTLIRFAEDRVVTPPVREPQS
jgi:hypothetical protein